MQVVCDQGDHRLIMMLLMRPNTDAPGSQHNVSSWCSWSPPWVVIIRIDLDNFGFSLFSCKFYSEFETNLDKKENIRSISNIRYSHPMETRIKVHKSTLNAHAIAINSLKIGQAFAFKYWIWFLQYEQLSCCLLLWYCGE